MTRLELMVLRWRPVRSVTHVTKRIILPGFHGVSLFDVASFFFKEIRKTGISDRSAAVTFNFLMAIPPTLLFLFSLIPYLPLRDVQQTILDTLRLVTPNQNIYNNISEVVVDFMNNERRDLLSFGVFMTLFFSSNGMMGLMRTFDRSHSVYVKRSGLRRRWIAIKLTFVIICVAIATLVALILQTEALNGLIQKIFGDMVPVRVFSIIIVVALIFFAISIIYRYGTSLSHKFRLVSPGSVFATILTVLTTAVFFFLINNFLNYSKVYGSIGTLIALMSWLYFNTIIMVLGYELNVSILLGKISKKKQAEINAAI